MNATQTLTFAPNNVGCGQEKTCNCISQNGITKVKLEGGLTLDTKCLMTRSQLQMLHFWYSLAKATLKQDSRKSRISRLIFLVYM